MRAAQLLLSESPPTGPGAEQGEERRRLLMGLGRSMGPSGSTDIDGPWAAEAGQLDPPAKGPSRRRHPLLQELRAGRPRDSDLEGGTAASPLGRG